MIYKIVIDATNALDALKKLGISKSVVKQNHLFVEANNPDEACFAAVDKLKDGIIAENISEEIVEFLEEELRYNVKITKLSKVRPYA